MRVATFLGLLHVVIFAKKTIFEPSYHLVFSTINTILLIEFSGISSALVRKTNFGNLLTTT